MNEKFDKADRRQRERMGGGSGRSARRVFYKKIDASRVWRYS